MRESAGLSVREVARLIGESHTNVSYWERSGQIPRSDVLVPLAKVLGVAIEELLGQPKAKRAIPIGGRLRQVFERAARLPRRQQEKVAEFVEAFVEKKALAS
jgi:transcriptional regulator with XRE-family HTH domain